MKRYHSDEPLLGWRVWHVLREGEPSLFHEPPDRNYRHLLDRCALREHDPLDVEALLVSLMVFKPWPRRAPLQAFCAKTGERKVCKHGYMGKSKAASFAALLRGDTGHVCGIHAFKTEEQALLHKLTAGGEAVGQVSLWGHVVEHEEGYRAEFAYPYSLQLYPMTTGQEPNRLRSLRRGYGVDVEERPFLSLSAKIEAKLGFKPLHLQM